MVEQVNVYGMGEKLTEISLGQIPVIKPISSNVTSIGVDGCKGGWVAAIILVLIRNSNRFEILTVYIVFIQLAILFISIIPTEISLKKNFNKNGQKK